MAVIYVWMPNKDSWGHASLLLKDTNVYISWWPKDDKSKKTHKVNVKNQFPESYEEDVENYTGRPATNQYSIDKKKINPRAVEDWWNSQEKSGYNLLNHNCCDIVYNALQAGGCFEWVVPPPSGISHPRSIDHYAQALVRTEHKGDLTLLQDYADLTM